jgi:triosephosphate isomerase
MRRWLCDAFGDDAGDKARIIYGGSVMPANTQRLLRSADVDGFGAGRKGREADAFARIVREIARAKGLI